MNKQLFNYAKRLLNDNRQGGKVKYASLAQALHLQHGFGQVQGQYLHFTFDDRASFIDQVQKESDLDLTDTYSPAKSRLANAATLRNEKANSYAVSRDFVLINSLNDFRLNGQLFAKTPFASLGLYIQSDQINSVEHSHIVLVENLAIMANLDALNLPDELRTALWLYRGDVKEQQHSSTAYQFFRRFTNSHVLVCFSDLDPAGIDIALKSGAGYWLTAQDTEVLKLELQGAENEWYNQKNSIKHLNSMAALPAICQHAFSAMLTHRKTGTDQIRRI
jgi:hypothetical protein